MELVSMGIYVGETAFWYSETQLGTPVPAEAKQRHVRRLKNNIQPVNNPVMDWRGLDFLDETWVDSTSTASRAYFYSYTDATNFGAPTTANQIWCQKPTYTIQFRGFKSV